MEGTVSTFIVSDKDVLAAINNAISWNNGDDATTDILISVGADIFGISDEEFEELLDSYKDY